MHDMDGKVSLFVQTCEKELGTRIHRTTKK